MSHQMVDLTEMWQVLDETSHSYPSDNVYRKVVRTKNLMNELAESGKAILMISSEMEELMGMSDRIVVLYEGRQTGEISKENFSQEGIMAKASNITK